MEKQAYQRGYKESYDTAYADAEEIYESGKRAMYQKGLKDAWEAARTLWNTPNRKEIFGNTTFNTVLTTLTAQETIEKIRQYEQEKEEQITKGDIVLIKSTPEVEILVTYADEEHVSGIALTEVDGNCEIGDQYTNIRISNVEKTGKHYDIVSVLQKMKDYHREILVKQKDGTEKMEPAYGKPPGFYTSLAGAVKAIARADYKEALSGRETPLNEAVKLMQETLERFEKILEGIKE